MADFPTEGTLPFIPDLAFHRGPGVLEQLRRQRRRCARGVAAGCAAGGVGV